MDSMNIFFYTDYREYLKDLFADKLRRNPRFSLRAFANQIDIFPSQLSTIFAGKKHLSYSSGLKIGKKLSLDEDQTEYFCLMIESQTAKASIDRKHAQSRMRLLNQVRPIREFSVDAFQAISDWYHLPILMMVDLADEKITAKIVSKRLGILEAQASEALDRLIRIGLLQLSPNGKYVRTSIDVLFTSEDANSGLRNYHKAMLLKAMDSLETQNNSEKFVGSETFCIDPSIMPEFKKTIEKFFSRCIRQARETPKTHEVYHLGVQFFRLTRKV